MEQQQNQYILALFDEYSDMVYRIALNRVKSIAVAEDIVQEVFLSCLEKQPQFNGKNHEKAWLIRVTINKSIDTQKRIWHHFTREMLPTDSYTVDVTENSVLEVVGALPTKYREVIYLFYYEGYAIKEIAVLLNKKESTVKSLLQRARKKLKVELSEVYVYE